MSAPGQIDTTSSYFASLAAQAAGKRADADTKKLDKTDKKKIRFEKVLEKQHETDAMNESVGTSMLDLPAELRNLPEDKILSALLDDVSDAGDALKEKPVPDNILRYKESVRNFIKFVVSKSFEVKHSDGIKIRRGLEFRQKKYTQIQVIDQKLEKLAAGIMMNQKDQLSILAKIEEINGLLVDLIS